MGLFLQHLLLVAEGCSKAHLCPRYGSWRCSTCSWPAIFVWVLPSRLLRFPSRWQEARALVPACPWWGCFPEPGACGGSWLLGSVRELCHTGKGRLLHPFLSAALHLLLLLPAVNCLAIADAINTRYVCSLHSRIHPPRSPLPAGARRRPSSTSAKRHRYRCLLASRGAPAGSRSCSLCCTVGRSWAPRCVPSFPQPAPRLSSLHALSSCARLPPSSIIAVICQPSPFFSKTVPFERGCFVSCLHD